MDTVLLQLKTPSRVALFDDLKALLEAAGMGAFLPARASEMVVPWRRAGRTGRSGYRLDWMFFDVIRRELGPDGEIVQEFDRGLHCDVLVSRTDPRKPPVRQVLATLAARIGELAEVDHDSPDALLQRWGVGRARVRQAGQGSVILGDVAAPHHRIAALDQPAAGGPVILQWQEVG